MSPAVCAAFALVLVLFSPFFLGGQALISKNKCSSPLSVFSIDGSISITIQPNNFTSIIEPDKGSSITFWGCRSDQTDCLNSENATATMGSVYLGSGSSSYSYSYILSLERGYNLGIKIIPGGANCPVISCTANVGQCPHQLRVTNADGVVIACEAPSCLDPISKELCSLFSSIIASDSHCTIAESDYDASSFKSTCPSAIGLLIIFTC